jgi:hypothetical protein
MFGYTTGRATCRTRAITPNDWLCQTGIAVVGVLLAACSVLDQILLWVPGLEDRPL